MADDEQFTGFAKSIYDLIVQQAGLDVVLSAITTVMETQLPEALVSVMLYAPETDTLDLVAGSSFSESYRDAMQAIPLGPELGACGSAAYNRELTICGDIANDHRWNEYHAVAAGERLAACWSTPLIEASGNLLGTFATYYREPRTPTDYDIKLIRRAAGLVVLAITHQREVRLRESTEEQLRLFERAIESSANSMVMTDALDPSMPMVYVNKAFLAMTGYSHEQVLGRNCRFLQGNETDPQAVAAIRHGLAKRERVEVTLMNYRKDGTPFWNKVLIEPVLNDSGGCTHFIGVHQDVTRERENELMLDQYSTHDLLTGLANRSLFEAQLARTCRDTRDTGTSPVVLLIDLDDFKPVNTSLGHAQGDQLLIMVAARLKQAVEAKDIVARLGGDEYAVLLTNAQSENEVIECAQAILSELSKPYEFAGLRLHISASIGIASPANRTLRPEELLGYADAAVQDAKTQGRNTWHWYEGSDTNTLDESVVLRHELMEAIDQQQFVLYYQPIVASGTAELKGVEALIRWQHPVKGLVPPGMFIPLAEQTGQIVAIGQWVLQQACSDFASWNKGRQLPIPVSVNISPLQFRRFGFVEELKRSLEASGLEPQLLELEVTENVLMSGTERAIETLKEIRALGVKVSVDDFGIGYSSLRYLRQLPINKVKLDRSFISDITENSHNAAIVQGVITMAHHLGLVVVGEGVETSAQAADLHQRSCDLLQGFLFSRPVPLDALPTGEQSQLWPDLT